MPTLPKLIPALLLQFLLFQGGPVYAASPPAAGPGGMSEEQMQQMMENARKLEQCFKNIDRTALDKLEEEGRKVEAEVNDLCKAGRKGEAQAAAVAYDRKVNGSKEVKAFFKCSKMANGMMGNISRMMDESRQQLQNGNVCDSK
ncbi:MAG: hypothetical protein P8126_12530 [Gammaproteobacteria bacterium]